MSQPSKPYQNQLLKALPSTDYERLAPHLELVELALGDVIYEQREPIDHVYFPLGSLISLISPVDHSATEFGLVGNEGMVGIPALLGGNSTINRAIVQLADSALRIESSVLKAEFDRGGPLQRVTLLYFQWLLTQTTQNGACQAHHSTEARLARWLLSVQDRLQVDELKLTQRFIAKLLGTRRATITAAAGQLQQAGLIRYSRGSITIINRPGLEESACECYALLQQEQQRLQAIL